MKHHLILSILLGWLVSASSAGSAQGKKTQPLNTWTQNGYWVVESNIHTPKINIVYIYNGFDSLVYTEKIEGRRINTKRKAIKRRLDMAVEKSLWASSAKRGGENSIVITILKNGD
jgi:hypothetical protein